MMPLFIASAIWTVVSFTFGLLCGLGIKRADEVNEAIWDEERPEPPTFSLCPDSFIPMPDGRLLEIWA